MSNTLVAYFSASGETAKLAKRLASAIGADLYEIEPVTPYTDEDLDWTVYDSRSTVEMEDRSSRPAIRNRVDDMQQYDTVFIGFPIWWGREPSIVDTFMEMEDFTDKKVVPFATSGGDLIGDSGANLQVLAPKAQVFEGKRFSTSAQRNELWAWAYEF